MGILFRIKTVTLLSEQSAVLMIHSFLICVLLVDSASVASSLSFPFFLSNILLPQSFCFLRASFHVFPLCRPCYFQLKNLPLTELDLNGIGGGDTSLFFVFQQSRWWGCGGRQISDLVCGNFSQMQPGTCFSNIHICTSFDTVSMVMPLLTCQEKVSGHCCCNYC